MASTPRLPPDISPSDFARLMTELRNNAAGLRAGVIEVADPAYQNSDRYLRDLRRMTTESLRGNLDGAATRAGAATTGGGVLGARMATGATSRALTRLIPVAGQVIGAGMLGGGLGTEIYNRNAESIQDFLARLTNLADSNLSPKTLAPKK